MIHTHLLLSSDFLLHFLRSQLLRLPWRVNFTINPKWIVPLHPSLSSLPRQPSTANVYRWDPAPAGQRGEFWCCVYTVNSSLPTCVPRHGLARFYVRNLLVILSRTVEGNFRCVWFYVFILLLLFFLTHSFKSHAMTLLCIQSGYDAY